MLPSKRACSLFFVLTGVLVCVAIGVACYLRDDYRKHREMMSLLSHVDGRVLSSRSIPGWDDPYVHNGSRWPWRPPTEIEVHLPPASMSNAEYVLTIREILELGPSIERIVLRGKLHELMSADARGLRVKRIMDGNPAVVFDFPCR